MKQKRWNPPKEDWLINVINKKKRRATLTDLAKRLNIHAYPEQIVILDQDPAARRESKFGKEKFKDRWEIIMLFNPEAQETYETLGLEPKMQGDGFGRSTSLLHTLHTLDAIKKHYSLIISVQNGVLHTPDSL